MLILSRKQEESIVIGDDIMIKVISIDRGSVKLGLEAPPKTLILRAELKEAVRAENAMASMLTSEDVLQELGKSIKKEINAKDIFKSNQSNLNNKIVKKLNENAKR